MSTVRRAVPADLPPVLDLAAQRRADYAEHRPRFWRPAEDARSRQSDFFSSLLVQSEVGFFVAGEESDDIVGFVVARVMPAPPVYDPGGLTCLVDDFVVADLSAWSTVGAELIATVRNWAREQGAVQLVAVTGRHDDAKREFFGDAGLSPASEWWVGETHDDQTGTPTDGSEVAPRS